MIQVKVFDEQHEDDLTDSLNEFLAELDEKDVLSVQLATSHFSVIPEQLYSFSGMIVYRIKSAEAGSLTAGGDDDE